MLGSRGTWLYVTTVVHGDDCKVTDCVVMTGLSPTASDESSTNQNAYIRFSFGPTRVVGFVDCEGS
jgi:hypothetical protein